MSSDSELFDFQKIHSTFDGKCFFEVIVDCLNKIFSDQKFSVESIKEKCNKYAQNNDNKWVQKIVIDSVRSNLDDCTSIKDNEIWKTYLLNLKYTFNDLVRMSNSDNTIEKIIYNQNTKNELKHSCYGGICGRIDIEGKIISNLYNVHIKLVKQNDILMTHGNDAEISLMKNGLFHYDVKAVHKRNVDNDKLAQPLSDNEKPSTKETLNNLVGSNNDKSDTVKLTLSEKSTNSKPLQQKNCNLDKKMKSIENLNNLSLTVADNKDINSTATENEKNLLKNPKDNSYNLNISPNSNDSAMNNKVSSGSTNSNEKLSNNPIKNVDKQKKRQNIETSSNNSNNNHKSNKRNRERKNKKFVPRDASQESVRSFSSSISSNTKVNSFLNQKEIFYDASSEMNPRFSNNQLTFNCGNVYKGNCSI